MTRRIGGVLCTHLLKMEKSFYSITLVCVEGEIGGGGGGEGDCVDVHFVHMMRCVCVCVALICCEYACANVLCVRHHACV